MPAQVVTGSTDRTAKVWNMRTGSCVRTFRTDSPIQNVASSLCGSVGVATTRHSTHLIDYKCSRTEELTHSTSGATIDTVTVSANGKYLVSGLSDGTITTQDIGLKRMLHTIKTKGERVKYLTTSSKLHTMIAAFQDQKVKVQDIKTAKMIAKLHHDDPVNVVATDSYQVVTATSTGMISLWWYKREHLFKTYDQHNSEPITAIAMKGKYVLSGDAKGRIVLFNIQLDMPMAVFENAESITAVAFSSDENYILASSLNNNAVMYNVETGQPERRFTGHDSGSIITSLAVSDCTGSEMLSSTEDCSIKYREAERKGRDAVRKYANVTI